MDEIVGIMLREERAPESQICYFLSFFISVMLKKKRPVWSGGSGNVIRMISGLSMEFYVLDTEEKRSINKNADGWNDYV